MSSFMVQDKTINRIVEWFVSQKEAKENGDLFYIPKLEKMVKDATGLDMNDKDFKQKFGEMLFEMNRSAVIYRYGRDDEYSKKGVKYVYQPTNETNNEIQVYKSMNCLLYQCAEGDISETKLFKLLDGVSNILAIFIVRKTKEYQEAEWE